MKVFIGWDSREDIAYQVCKYTIQKYTNNIEIIPLRQYELRERGIYNRPEDIKGTTEFTLTRFLVPYLSQYKGKSLYIDGDMIVREDITNILKEENGAVSVVKHEYLPKSLIKKDKQDQHNYPRKNWSSVMLFDNSQCINLTPEMVNSSTPEYLHRLHWAETIGSLHPRWNTLVGYQKNQDGILHFTDGGPWLGYCRDIPEGKEWITCLKECYEIE